ncbi:hypothetical protein LAZ67_11002775 [Cordylochernes scorpioides]|uniref:Ankyrin repeat protein n=1 Tax=Cordylochernes scorpioides TaxID=51811 RepID=A0ABY6L065_9ARAC|nr:hypothetical protein LAZ67_11002775 [Cordylochernes scorpioides]
MIVCEKFTDSLKSLKILSNTSNFESILEMESEMYLFQAIWRGHLEEVKKLVEEGVLINVKLDSKKMLEYNHEENEKNWIEILIDCDTPLHLATKMGNYDINRFLVDNGADINASNVNNITALHYSIIYEHFEIFYDLIESGADYNGMTHYGLTPLMLASSNYNTSFMKELLKRGADIEAKDDLEHTAIYHTLMANFENFKILYDAGADVNICSKLNTPFLLEACREEALEIVVFLIKLGVDINQKNSYGDTPLANTLNNGGDEITKVLIMAGAIIDSRNKVADTPLHEAASQLNETIVHTLIEAGADVNLRNGNGETPLIIAANTCVEFILEDEFDNENLRTLELLLRNTGDIDLEIFLRNSAVENNMLFCRPILKVMIKYFVLQHPTENKPEDIHLPKDLSDWWKDCQSQVQLIQSHILGESDISLYRILTESDQHKVMGFLSNDATGLRQALEINYSRYKEYFPIYAEVIKQRFNTTDESAISLCKCFLIIRKLDFTKSNKCLMLKIVKQLHCWNCQQYLHADIVTERTHD